MLAGLVRCTLASLDYSARRAGVNVVGSGSAHGVVTKREEDGLYAFVDIETTLDVQVAPQPRARRPARPAHEGGARLLRLELVDREAEASLDRQR